MYDVHEIVRVCGKCQKIKNITEFQNSEAERETKRRDKFDRLVGLVTLNLQQVMELDSVRTSHCKHCRDIIKRCNENPNSKRGACREYWYELRQEPCIDCLEDRANGIDTYFEGYSEFDHRYGKVKPLSRYDWWACNGGVPAMKEEREKCDARCAFHHILQPSMSIYKGSDPQTMPTDTKQQRNNKRHRQYKLDKRAYVNELKLNKRQCYLCSRPVLPHQCHAFDFAHNTASNRGEQMRKLVNNTQKLETAKPQIDDVLTQTRLLCRNCHAEETRLRNQC